MNYFLATRKIYKCSSCRVQFSATQGTIFEKSKMPLTKWFLAIYFFTSMKRSISSCQLAKLLGVQQRTAWFVLQRLRLATNEENENFILKGVVEADEAFISPNPKKDLRLQKKRRVHNAQQEAIHGISRKKARTLLGPRKQGRKKGSTKEVNEQKRKEKEAKGKRIPFERLVVVFGMTEQGGRVILKKLGHSKKCVSQKNIYPLLKTYIDEEAILNTDNLNVYDGVDFLKHRTVNHTKRCYVKKDGTTTNSIENVWKHFKKMIEGTYFHISKHHFDKYLNEYTYRWNRRNESELVLFNSFLPLVAGKKITFKKLTIRDENKMAA